MKNCHNVWWCEKSLLIFHACSLRKSSAIYLQVSAFSVSLQLSAVCEELRISYGTPKLKDLGHFPYQSAQLTCSLLSLFQEIAYIVNNCQVPIGMFGKKATEILYSRASSTNAPLKQGVYLLVYNEKVLLLSVVVILHDWNLMKWLDSLCDSLITGIVVIHQCE